MKKSKRSSIPFTFAIPRAHLAALRELARKSGLPVAAILRRSVAAALADTTTAVEAFTPVPRA